MNFYAKDKPSHSANNTIESQTTKPGNKFKIRKEKLKSKAYRPQNLVIDQPNNSLLVNKDPDINDF